ncbi:unnamed protein product [Effrenium voratum]|uniref:Uncharacterized protein n=1 Tax=Effrenium voratum TaxID=2562239 RepID=A0AA36J8P2_9DINO|nr:unnamed protein product [Effrenium voratum]CAJ1400554.1 unnamed protein product [Effrenium voratum]CAJ1455087.1 unnamed protein product [Effrenium voratum]|eukprot:CAMPEP_0181428344 /NCGR_PEP_ID=MMETSP1110-20121109/16631_1 /TAXON_ID=174948 /ORGANISM="Symbiodinium sp., Strain CCMP421" /LENGTH=235 /DNA_ID=CAMNT_0023551569 /DNA_START=57 /DNA_END=764 /DNA_ORIENTATION=+
MAVAVRGRQLRLTSALVLLGLMAASTCFIGASAPRSRGGIATYAAAAKEAAPSPPPAASSGSSVALVKVTKENKIATAGVLGGVAGLLLGGFWIGAAGFAATSYLAKKEEDDVATALQSVSSAALEAVNFADYVNSKYEVTDKVGSALTEALDKNADAKDSLKTVKSSLDTVKEAIDSFDKDVGIKETLGSLVLAGSDLASQLTSKVVELNKEYKVTDQLKAKIDEALEKSSKKA